MWLQDLTQSLKSLFLLLLSSTMVSIARIPNMEAIDLPQEPPIKSRICYDAFGLTPWIVLTDEEQADWLKLKMETKKPQQQPLRSLPLEQKYLRSSYIPPPPGFAPIYPKENRQQHSAHQEESCSEETEQMDVIHEVESALLEIELAFKEEEEEEEEEEESCSEETEQMEVIHDVENGILEAGLTKLFLQAKHPEQVMANLFHVAGIYLFFRLVLFSVSSCS